MKINATELLTALQSVGDFEEWYKALVAEQKALAPTADPVLTRAVVERRQEAAPHAGAYAQGVQA